MDMLMITNLGLDITRNCNFKCAHCLKGEAVNENLNSEVLPKIFKPGVIIQNLELSGGEVFLDSDIFCKTIDFIINSGAIILHLNIITNGTCYTKKIENSLKKMDLYIEKCRMLTFGMKNINGKNVDIELSVDEYHQDEMTKIKKEDYSLYKQYMDNVNNLLDSSFFSDYRDNDKIFDKGRARNLNIKKYKPYRSKMYYNISNYEKINTLQVSSISVNVKGYVKRTKNGSLVCNDLKDIIKENGIRCINENEFMAKYQEDLYNALNPALSTLNNNKSKKTI